MPDLFLSYNRSDRDRVSELRRVIEARGISTFLDEDLQAGLPWPQALENALSEAGAVAVFLGRDGLGTWQKREMYLAQPGRESHRDGLRGRVFSPGGSLVVTDSFHRRVSKRSVMTKSAPARDQSRSYVYNSYETCANTSNQWPLYCARCPSKVEGDIARVTRPESNEMVGREQVFEAVSAGAFVQARQTTVGIQHIVIR